MLLYGKNISNLRQMSVNLRQMSGMAKHSNYRPSENKANKIEEPAMVYLSGITTANPLEAIGKIRGGLQKNVLDKFMAVSGFSLADMARILHTSERTLQRYTASHLLNADQSERILELLQLFDRGCEVLGS